MKIDIFSDFKDFLERFTIKRNGIVIAELDGLKSSDNRKKHFDFPFSTDIQRGDCVESVKSHIEYYIYDIDTQTMEGDIVSIMAFYQTKSEFESSQRQSTTASNTYHIGNAYGSIIGSQSTATISNSCNLDELKTYVEQNIKEDKEQINELIETIKAITCNNIPMQKGTLSRFGDLLAKHSWLTGPLTQLLINWFAGK